MSDEVNAPEGGGDASASAAVITPAENVGHDLSVSEAGRALAAARRKKPAEASPVEAAPAEAELPAQGDDSTPPQEVPAETTETTETPDPAEELPLIEAPRSWTKEEKERFQSYPRELQAYLSEREQQRDREVRRSQNEAAEQRKAIEAERKQAEQARQQYEASLEPLRQAIQDAQAGQYADIKSMADVERLATEDPLRYLQWQAHQQKVQAVQAEISKAEQRKSQEAQDEHSKFVESEAKLLIEAVPELADTKKRQDVTTKVVEMLRDNGYSDAELGELAGSKFIHDHRIQLALIDATRWQAAQKSKLAVTKAPVPPVQRPGTARPQGAAAAENIQALTTRLNSTGDLKDAVAVLAARRAGRRS